ncbi:hypothetical protein Cgig2_019480 [Carnegiea gigantea]|uniref:DUF4283 domain-containing protein n=1 Tax=Carnegiea gigantea TaxID=171969 RepID=A0A9Q1KRF9_9CARY|nr:hypothetical protein Cgig2_019480 [Carnegiea gigantea]
MIKGKSEEENGTITADKHNGAKGQLEKSRGERSKIITGEGSTSGNEEQQNERIIKGELNVEFKEWLNRSFVRTLEEPRDLGALATTLISYFGQYTKISSLSKFKFILTFPSIEQMEEVLGNHDELGHWFINVKRLDEYETCETGRVWIEIFGVPPRGWKGENFRRITELWGRVVCLGKGIDNSDSFEFESMKVLIDTDILGTINWEIVIIVIKEVSSTVQVIQKVHTTSNSSMEAMNSNHEEKDDDVALDDDVACSELRRNDKMARTTEEEAVQEKLI